MSLIGSPLDSLNSNLSKIEDLDIPCLEPNASLIKPILKLSIDGKIVDFI